jgi:hypothetical protein
MPALWRDKQVLMEREVLPFIFFQFSFLFFFFVPPLSNTTGAFGGVGAVRGVKNPIKLAANILRNAKKGRMLLGRVRPMSACVFFFSLSFLFLFFSRAEFFIETDFWLEKVP